VDGRLAQLLLRILNKHLVEVHIVDAMQSDKGRQDVRSEVLQDVELNHVLALMPNPCKKL
jgi:hypothetical protein